MINLPANPGLARRLAYSNYVRSRSQQVQPQQTQPQQTQPQQTQPQQAQYTVGLCLDKLIQNTTVEITTIPFFCPVCQNIKENNCISRHLSCGHTFHIECIEYWLKDNTNCPMCRKDLQ
jgi:hypothetical protein